MTHPVLARIFLGVCAFTVFLVGIVSLHGTDAQRLERDALPQMLEKVGGSIELMSVEYDKESPVRQSKQIEYAREWLIWDTRSNHFYSKKVTYHDSLRNDAVDWVIATWDGSEYVSWHRKIGQPNQWGGVDHNGEPNDPGTIVRMNRPAFGEVALFERLLRPSVFGSLRLDTKRCELTRERSLYENLPGDIINLREGPWNLRVHEQTGWSVEIGLSGPKMVENIRLSEFRLKAGSGRVFPLEIMRTLKLDDLAPIVTKWQIKLEALKFNEDVQLPVITLPPHTRVQDDVTGKFRVVTEDGPRDEIEIRMSALLKDALEKAKRKRQAQDDRG
jgi:hypothetical protein